MEYNSHFAGSSNITCLEGKVFKDAVNLGKNYNRFESIDINQKDRIQTLSSAFFNSLDEKLVAQKYARVLNYLSTLYGKSKLCDTRGTTGFIAPTYDEYLAFVISSCDPDCKMFTTYLKCDKKLSHDKKRNIVRKETEFFSELLLKAEKDYYFKFINNLICDVGLDNSSYLSLLTNMIKSFDDVSFERFDEISKLALLWNFSASEEHRYTTCLYNIIYQPKLLGLNSVSEKMLFFITAVDPDLKLLTIYEEETRINMIKNRSLVELGFYNPNLIKIEKLVKNKYMPEKKVSAWSL